MPGEHLAPTPAEPVPFRFPPQPVDALAQPTLLGRIAIEIRAHTQQPLEQQGALDEIGAIVLAAEGHGGAAVPAHEMRIHAVIAGRPLQAIQHSREARNRLLAGDPAALAGDDERHDAEAAAADGHRRVGLLGAAVTAIEREAADRVRPFPEVAKGLTLDEIEQLLIGERLPALVRR